MESHSVNVVQEPGNDRRRRHSFTLRDEQLLKILSAPPDEPLYINDTAINKTTLNGDINSFGDNLLIQYETVAAAAAATATSSIAAVDDYENENLPPADKFAVANIEGYTQFVYTYIFYLFSYSLQYFHLVLLHVS